jgi:predicted 3-demethylubiquinone-9 3-methyltransferase (glyoxalase superfamily)
MIKANQKISPFLWFENQAEEAAKFYTSIFKDSKITGVNYYTEAGPQPKGTVMTVSFELEGQRFTALNGGPVFKFNEAVSFVVNCETQAEIDTFWQKLSEGGQEVQCGWLKDKYGLSWQIVPTALFELLMDSARARNVMQALFKMKKIDIETLRKAHDQ